jgi:hypothetical protein
VGGSNRHVKISLLRNSSLRGFAYRFYKRSAPPELTRLADCTQLGAVRCEIIGA